MKQNRYYGWLIITLLGLYSNCTAATELPAIRRDPFAISSGTDCQPPSLLNQDIVAVKEWRFQGVIGQGELWLGWLYSVRDGWHSVSPGETFMTSGWQVQQVTQSFTQLIAQRPLVADCIRPETISLPLIMD